MGVSNPIKHRNRWRIVVSTTGDNGKRTQTASSFETEAEALRFKRKCEAEIDGKSLSEATEAYLMTRKLSERSRETDRQRLRGMLKLNEGDQPVTLFGVGQAKALYRDRVAKCAPDTHHAELFLCRRAWDHFISNGWCSKNPWDEVDPEGERRSRPKDQIRVNESRHFADVALAEGTKEGLAVATILILGLRSSELVTRQVRDLDDNGSILWIPDSKTPTGVRQIGVPEVLQERLLDLCVGKANNAPLFGLNSRGRPLDRHWVHHHVERICGRAGLERFTTHSLRGLHSTLATLNEVAAETVAAALGHASTSVGKRHYIAPGTQQTVSAKRVANRLGSK